MLTLLDSISLAGDRAKQNDDCAGALDALAWVIDGATDLHSEPLTDAATDAAWVAQRAHAHIMRAAAEGDASQLRELTRAASAAARAAFKNKFGPPPAEHWKSPIASLLIARETPAGVEGLDLGDCRLFALDAVGNAHAIGGPPAAADRETELAKKAAEKADGAALLRDAPTIDMLRRMRDTQNREGSSWTFGLDPACADHARLWALPLARPAHLLFASDGFAALVDRYEVMNAAAFIAAALARGLHALALDLRAIETGDAAGARYPRWKKSDDATALLLRLD